MNASPSPMREHSANGSRESEAAFLHHLAELAQRGLALHEYFSEYLRIVTLETAAVAGAVWVHATPGHLQIQAQRQMPLDALVNTSDRGAARAEMRLRGFEHTEPLVSPTSGVTSEGEHAHPIAWVPILIDQQVVRLLELWFPPGGPASGLSAAVEVAGFAARLAADYVRSFERQQLQVQQQIWAQLNAFVVAIHGTLHPTEVAYYVANEGRRMIGCDRCSVALRFGDKVRIEAISGLDAIEKRSNLVWTMRVLCDRVLSWGEPLHFVGTKDESLPPSVLDALDAYLAESSCRSLTVLPLRDPREGHGSQPLRTALVMECFESTSKHGKLVERLRVVGQHAAGALFNATEYATIPLRPLWLPLVWLRHGLGGTTRLILAGISAAVLVLMAALLWVPYPLKMDAKGQLLPEERAWIYAPVESQVVSLAPGVTPGARVVEHQSLMLMYDVQLQMKIVQLQSEIASAQRDIETLAAQADTATSAEQQALGGDRKKREFILERKVMELRALCERNHAVEGRPGYFWLRSSCNGTVLNADFRDSLVNRTVKPSDPLLRVGDKSGSWEIVLKIPQQHLGQVLLAYGTDDPRAELDVDLLLVSMPTRTFRGKLSRSKIGSEASPAKDDGNPEPVLLASVRIEGPDILEADQLPRPLLVTGTEVHAKIRCGNQRLGYSLFYGVWEFFYEKVVFFF